MPGSLFVLVTGATGRQGGVLARSLLNQGHRVRALIRNEEHQDISRLRSLGAEISKGDFEDQDSLVRAMRDVSTVFAMSTPAGIGFEAEIRHGKNLAQAAKEVGVQHYIYSSAAGANRSTGVSLLEAKVKIEQWIRNIGLPFTIIGSVFFMENLFAVLERAELAQGRVSLPLPRLCKLQQVALEDFASFVTLVIENRDQFLGRRLDIASDELTGIKIAEVLGKVTGRQLIYSEMAPEAIQEENSDLVGFYEWLGNGGMKVNIELLRRQFPEVGWHNYEKWASKQDWQARLE